jgi:hypothetical protein
MKHLKTFEDIHIHDRWEQQSIEKEDIKEFAETLFVDLLDEGFTVETVVIYSEYTKDYNKYVDVRIRHPHNETSLKWNSTKYSVISNQIQTFVDYIKRKWNIIDTIYEYEELLPDENIGGYTKVRRTSKEPSKNTGLFNGKFNLTIKQLDKEPNMLQKFIKRF